MSIVNKVLKGIFGSKSDRDLKILQPIVDNVKQYEPAIAALTNDQLRQKSVDFRNMLQDEVADLKAEVLSIKQQIEQGDVPLDDQEALYVQIDSLNDEINKKMDALLDRLMPEAFAVMRETARRFKANDEVEVTASDLDRQLAMTNDHIEIRGDKAFWKNNWMAAGNRITWDMVHYDVQLIGGAVLHQGKIAEMATGEGKTLVATLPVYLNALTGRGVHLVTVNDYLAKRDSEWMAPLFQFHGLTIDCIDKHPSHSPERRKAYLADITYGTNNEFGFDYLRDNMARGPEDLVQREHSFAIVDEVDSVLIDDARTPLIISGPIPKGKDQKEFGELKPKVEKLVQAQRDLVTKVLAEAKKEIAQGNTKDGGFLLLRAYRGLPKNKALIKFLSEEGNKSILQKTENTYMQDQGKEMHKVDAELFFVIDEKHNAIELSEKGIELISSDTDANFFLMPDINMGMAALEKENLGDKEKAEKRDELLRDYAIKSERIHTLNQLLKAYTLFELDVEYVIMDSKVKIVDEQTGRIMEGRRYSDGLHQAIEAKENVKIEAATQTFATITLQNYFRMYKKLAGMTGTAETEAGEFWSIYKLDVVVIPTNRPISRKDINDLVYKTKREKYNAIVEEIISLRDAGRPILVGTTSVEVSELLSRMLQLRKINHQVLNAKLHKKEADIVAEAGKPGTVTIATNMAGRGTDIKIGEDVKRAGGLAIIGTERHDSRRVDRQLRGRSGRQGDPGSSQFFVSLEDNLMRLFGSDRMAGIMDRLGLKEGEVIQHSMITKSIERAQKKVEENNFGIRKRLLEYDDVMNSQREVIYKRRRHALFGERIQVDIANMMYDTVESLVANHQAQKDFEAFKLDAIRFFTTAVSVTQEQFLKQSQEEIVQRTYEDVMEHYRLKTQRIAEAAWPVIKQVYEQQSGTYKNIVVPFTDGNKVLQVVVDLEEAYRTEGKKLNEAFEKNIILAMIDDAWKNHLREMDDLKQSVQGAVYEQKDPLLIYKFESFELFRRLLGDMNQEIGAFLFKGNLPSQDPSQVREARSTRSMPDPNMRTGREGENNNQNTRPGAPQGPPMPRNTEPAKADLKISRNDKVKIKNPVDGETREVKYKQAKVLIDNENWILIEH
jgi:preprotein translocase subunit SecA